MTFDRPIALPDAKSESADADAAPQVGRAARLLVWLALAVPGLGTLVGGVVIGMSAHSAARPTAALPVLALCACLPLPAIAGLLRIRDHKRFRTASLTLAWATLLFAFLALMLAVGFLYLPSAVLLLLAWGATYGPARIRSNAAAMTGILLVGILVYFVGWPLVAVLRS